MALLGYGALDTLDVGGELHMMVVVIKMPRIGKALAAIRNQFAARKRTVPVSDEQTKSIQDQPKLIKVVQPEAVTLQIIPDRSARNWSVDALTRALHDLYRPLVQRIRVNGGLEYQRQDQIAFDITLEADSIRFWLTIPEPWEEYARQKVATVWPRATVRWGEIPRVDPDRCCCAQLCLREHNFFSLRTARNDNRPLDALMEASRDLKEGDLARIQVIATPIDRQEWERESVQAYQAHQADRRLRRQDFTPRAALRCLGNEIDQAFAGAAKTAGEIAGVKSKPVQGLSILRLRRRKELSDATIRKATAPVFSAVIRVAAESEDESRAQIAVKSISSAYNELAADNEFERRDIPARYRSRFAAEVNAQQLPRVQLGRSVLSAAELAKMMQLPGAELQDQYPAIEQIPQRETKLPAIVTAGGLKFGTQKVQGQEIPVYMPTSNHDELCLPHVVIGGMGTGKTKGFGVNLAVEAVRVGFGAVVIDPARGEIGDEVESVLDPDQVLRIRFGRGPVALDWREATHSERARNRLANELVAFCEAASDEAGAQTIRYLRSAAKAVPGGRLSEVVSLMTDPAYRAQLIPAMRTQEQVTWQAFSRLSEARQMQIAMPVLNRLDVIQGDDYLAECMECPEGLDFVGLLKEPGRVIVLDIPKAELGAEAVDVLAALVASKLDLAMTLRQSDHPVFVIQDEPHQYMRSARTWRSAAVESRKWRFAYTWMFHSWEQIPRSVATIIQAAGPHYHIYSSSKQTYRELAEEIRPFTVEEAMETPRHWAINVIRAGGVTVSPFLAKMSPPPSVAKGR